MTHDELTAYIARLRDLFPLCDTDDDARWLACVIAGLEWLAARCG